MTGRATLKVPAMALLPPQMHYRMPVLHIRGIQTDVPHNSAVARTGLHAAEPQHQLLNRCDCLAYQAIQAPNGACQVYPEGQDPSMHLWCDKNVVGWDLLVRSGLTLE